MVKEIKQTEKEFQSALLLVARQLLEHKATKCEVKDEIFMDYGFDIDIQIKKLYNVKTGKMIISKR